MNQAVYKSVNIHVHIPS